MNHNLFIDLFIVMCADNEAFNHGYCYQFCGELQCALEHIFFNAMEKFVHFSYNYDKLH